MRYGLLKTGIITLVVPAALLAILSVRKAPGHDYLPMHAAAVLLRAGDNPYQVRALQQAEAPLTAADPALYYRNEFIAYYYPPWLALLCVPLTVLSYALAKGVWVFLAYLSLVLAGQGLRTLPGLPSPFLIVLALLAVPACLAAHMGQTSAQVLVLLVLAWWLIDRGLDTGAGVALAWLTLKPQMTVVVIPAVLFWSARQARWDVIRSFAVMMAALCLGSTLRIPSWPWDMVQAPRISPLPSATNPGDGVAWLSVLQTLGLARWPLLLAYAAVALPMTAMALRAAGDRTRASAEVFALGVLAAFFVSPHALGYDYAILVFPMLVFVTGLPERRATALLLGVTIGFNLHFSVIQGGTTRMALVWLFWLPAGLALCGIAREVGARRTRAAGGPNRHVHRTEAALGHSGLRADHAPGFDSGSPRLDPERAARAGQP
jgi:hypothetical protein